MIPIGRVYPGRSGFLSDGEGLIEIDGVIVFSARVRIQAGEEQHAVGVFVFHNLIVDILHVILRIDSLSVDFGNDETILHAGFPEGPLLQSCHFDAAADAEFRFGVGAEFHKCRSELREFAGFGDFGTSLVIAQGGGGGGFLVVAVVGDGDFFAGTELVELLYEFGTVLYAHIIYCHYYISTLQAELFGGGACGDIMHEETRLGGGHIVLFGQLGIEFGDGASQHCALHSAILTQVGDHLLYDCSGYGERESRIASGIGIDGGIDADQFAFEVDKSSAGVAGIQSGVSLDEGFDAEIARLAVGAQTACFGADDAGCDSGIEPLRAPIRLFSPFRCRRR